MRIYTSYYAKMKDRWWEYALVRISTNSPAWFPVGLSCLPELYPGWELVFGIKEGRITWGEYQLRYNAILAKLCRDDIMRKLWELSDLEGGRDVVLLCYEAAGKLCHRHLVAEWLGNAEEL